MTGLLIIHRITTITVENTRPKIIETKTTSEHTYLVIFVAESVISSLLYIFETIRELKEQQLLWRPTTRTAVSTWLQPLLASDSGPLYRNWWHTASGIPTYTRRRPAVGYFTCSRGQSCRCYSAAESLRQ